VSADGTHASAARAPGCITFFDAAAITLTSITGGKKLVPGVDATATIEGLSAIFGLPPPPPPPPDAKAVKSPPPKAGAKGAPAPAAPAEEAPPPPPPPPAPHGPPILPAADAIRIRIRGPTSTSGPGPEVVIGGVLAPDALSVAFPFPPDAGFMGNSSVELSIDGGHSWSPPAVAVVAKK
jgi:hypothetical protein